MRIFGDVVFEVNSRSRRSNTTTTRKTKCFMTVSRTRGNKYQIEFSTQNNLREHVFPLDPYPKIQGHTKRGMLTFMFVSRPPTTVYMSGMDHDKLTEFMHILYRIQTNKSVDLEILEEVKQKDFKPRTIIVDGSNKEKYREITNDFSDQTETFKIVNVDMRLADKKWKRMTNLTTLVLKGNPFGATGLDVICELRHLVTLEFTHCQMSQVENSNRLFTNMMVKLPQSIQHLDLRSNGLQKFPKIFHLVNLKRLLIPENEITIIPSRIGFFRQLEHLNVGTNKLYSLPSTLENMRLQRLDMSGNKVKLLRSHIPLVARTQLMHPSRMWFMHYGRVDRLSTIAAHAVNTNERLRNFAYSVFPQSLSYLFLDYVEPEFSDTSVDLCAVCWRLTQIRTVTSKLFRIRQLTREADVLNEYVTLSVQKCVQCSDKDYRFLPLNTNYWRHGRVL